MENKPKAYKDFLDSLCNTEGVNYYSKKDLANTPQSLRKSDERYANLLETLHLIFSSLNEEQKNALGDWNEYIYQRGIEFALATLGASDNLVLAIRENNEIQEILPKSDYGTEFWKHLKKERKYP
jgi:hypothetical protein